MFRITFMNVCPPGGSVKGGDIQFSEVVKYSYTIAGFEAIFMIK